MNEDTLKLLESKYNIPSVDLGHHIDYVTNKDDLLIWCRKCSNISWHRGTNTKHDWVNYCSGLKL